MADAFEEDLKDNEFVKGFKEQQGKAKQELQPQPQPKIATKTPRRKPRLTSKEEVTKKETVVPAPKKSDNTLLFTEESIRKLILRGEKERNAVPKLLVTIDRPSADETSESDPRQTNNNVRLVQLARANYVAEINKFNTSFE